MRILKKIISISILSASLLGLSICSYAEEVVEIPEPLKVVDFSYSFNELAKQDEEFEVIDNAASPSLVEDDKMGQVLRLGKAVINNQEFAQRKDEETGTTSTTGVIISDDSEYSTINISNPFAGVDHLVEYAPYEDVKTTMYGICQQPLWEKGITIGYWVKAPKGNDGYGLNSNVLGFTSERFQIQADDYAKYLCTVKFDLDYSKYTETEKEELGIGVSGVDSESDFYYQLAEEKTYNDKPLYDYETLGRIYWMNKNYVNGYVEYDDGTIETCEAASRIFFDENDCYDNYSESPYLGESKDDHNSGTSNLRYAWTYSEMWLDSSSSFYFTNDEPYINEQLNPNHEESYSAVMGMQDCDSFNINSWRHGTTVAEADSRGNAADSPVLEPDEWHYVTVIIQNDWVRYYLDGEEINTLEEYSSFGTASVEHTMGSKAWKRFNKGTGSRYGYGNDKTETYWCYYGNYCSPTIMEWITSDCVNLSIGGGNRNGDRYMMFADTDGIFIKNIAFYDQMLTDEQIKVLAEKPEYYEGIYPYLGDANADKKISARDALLVLKHSAKLEELEETEYVDVNSDGNVNSEDALLILEYAAEMIDAF